MLGINHHNPVYLFAAGLSRTRFFARGLLTFIAFEKKKIMKIARTVLLLEFCLMDFVVKFVEDLPYLADLIDIVMAITFQLVDFVVVFRRLPFEKNRPD